MKHITSKLLSLLLTLAMLLSMIPAAYAVDDYESAGMDDVSISEETTADGSAEAEEALENQPALLAAALPEDANPDVWDTLTLTRADGTALVAGTDYTVTLGKYSHYAYSEPFTYHIYNVTTSDPIVISGGAQYKDSSLTYPLKSRVALGAGVTSVTLSSVTALGELSIATGSSVTFTLAGDNNVDKILGSGTTTYMTFEGDGSLTGEHIGGVNKYGADPVTNVGCNITINSGTFNITAGYESAIGGGQYGNAGTITINGGNITAKSNYGAAIGGGQNGGATEIIVNDGEINATGSFGAAIGGGQYGGADKITISGGTITARGSHVGAAIGGGQNGDAGTIEISGGELDIAARNVAIGGQTVEKITISGGTIDMVKLDSSSKEGPADASMIGASTGGSEDVVEISGGKFNVEVPDDYLADGANYDANTGEVTSGATEPTAYVTVNNGSTKYTTLDDAIANAEPVGGVITYKITGTVNANGESWIQVAKAGLTDLTKVEFIGETGDAGICITSEIAVLADQNYDIDVSFADLKLSKANPTYAGDYGHSTEYFTCWLRNDDAANNTVTYTNCTFPNGVCNNQYGKTVFDDCQFTNEAEELYNLWNYGGNTEIKNSEFTGTRGIKAYSEGADGGDIKISNTKFEGLTEKSAVVASKATDITFENVTTTGCAKGTFQKDIEGSGESFTVGANGSDISGSFNVTADKGQDAANNEFNISAGTFTGEVSEDYLADGFTLVDNGNGTYGVTETPSLARIGDKKYATLAEAIAAAKDGDTVKLLADCNGNGIQIKTEKFATKGLTVDFGSYTYSVGGVLVGSATTGTNAFQLLQGGKVTFQNGTIAGVSENTKPAEDTPNWHGAPAMVIQNYCDLTLSGMNIIGGDETVYTMSNNHGDVVIENTTITAGGAKGYGYGPFAFDVCGFSSYDGPTVTVKNSKIEGDIEISYDTAHEHNVSLILETGTTIEGELVAGNNAEKVTVTKSSDVKLDAPDGYEWADNGGGNYSLTRSFYQDADGVWHIATANGLAQFADSVTRTNTYKDQKVVLDADIDMSNIAYMGAGTKDMLTEGKGEAGFEGTFDGQGHTIHNLTVTNDTSVNYTGLFYLLKGTVQNLTIDGAACTGNRVAVLAGAANSCTVQNVTIQNSKVNGIQKCGGLIGFIRGGCTVEIDGCRVEDVLINGQADEDGVWQAGGLVGYINTNTNATISNNAVSNITIEDAYKAYIDSGNSETSQYSSHAFIGTIVNTANTAGAYGEYVITLTSNSVEGNAGVYTNKTFPNNKFCGEYADCNSKTVDGMIYPTKLVIDGDEVTALPVAEVGSNQYKTLAEAIAAAEDGQTVKLLGNVTESVTVSNKSVILDLSGKTLTNADGKHTITVEAGASLTINGDGTVDNVTHAKAAIVNYGTVVLNGGTYTRSLENEQNNKNDAGGNSYYTILNDKGGHMTINDGVTVTNVGHFSSMIRNGGDEKITEKSTLIINGGTFSGGINTVKNDELGVLEINGGSFSNTSQYVIMNWNEAAISGGTFEANTIAEAVLFTAAYHEDRAVGELTITGGTFKTTSDTQALIDDTYGADYVGTAAISGGSFSKLVEQKWCALGYEPNTTPVGGMYTVKEADGDAAMFNAAGELIGYADVEDALKNSNAKTVKLINDVETESFRVRSGKTLDLNGKVLTVEYAVAVGSIIDSSEGKGKVAVDKGALSMTGENGKYLPLYDKASNAYRFYSYKLTAAAAEEANTLLNTILFWFKLTLENPEGYQYFADTNDNGGVEMYATIGWSGSGSSSWLVDYSGSLNDFNTRYQNNNLNNGGVWVYIALGNYQLVGSPATFNSKLWVESGNTKVVVDGANYVYTE